MRLKGLQKSSPDNQPRSSIAETAKQSDPTFIMLVARSPRCTGA